MIDQAIALLTALLAVSSVPTKAEISEGRIAIERCTAAAEMLAAAYTTYPDDVQRRTDLINREKAKLHARLGITDEHHMSAYGALAFYDGKRMADVISKNEPINGIHIAAKGAANCMARTFHRRAP